MTARNLTSSFDRYRQENLSSRDVKLLLEPTWTDFYSQANEELERIKFLLRDKTDTEQIRRLFHSCEQTIKRVSEQAKSDPVALVATKKLFLDLQEQHKIFNKFQQGRLEQLKSEESESEKGAVFEDQTQDMLRTERHQEIVKLAESINELGNLIKELNTLVIAQGEIVDRIDYNIEKTATNVTEANKELKIAYREQGKTKSCLCIIVLSIIVCILTGILIWKKN